jgi:ABC-type glycerol-3-phosphate transport system substrate-binding protein
MKKNFLKKVLSTALVVAMAATMLVGCGKKDEAADAGKEEEKQEATEDEGKEEEGEGEATSDAAWDTSKKDTIIVSVINNFYTAGEKALAEKYMEMHPETEVVVDVIADNDSYLAKLMTAADGEYAPDIVHANFYTSAMGLSYKDLIERGELYDCELILDEVNPYNDGKLVREAFEAGEVDYMINSNGGSLGYLPLDRIGIGIYYNKDVLDKEGIAVPTSIEELIQACEKLMAAGYDQPLGAAAETDWMIDTIADCAYRGMQDKFLTVEGDALYNADSMAVNNGFKFDENDLSCDYYTTTNEERMLGFLKENGVKTDINKAAWEIFMSMAKYFPKNYLSEDSTNVLVNFETQITPLMYMPSYSVGNVNADIKMLPEDQQFTWGTTNLKYIGEGILPEGFDNDLRALWVYGNVMGIAMNDKTTEDHLARVKDFLKFWYSVDGATLCFEETLKAGNYIQGPCIIQGVTLAEDLQMLLDGFPTYQYKSLRSAMYSTDGSEATTAYRNANMECAEGKITVDEFLDILQGLTDDSIAAICDRKGLDLDPTTADTARE